MITEDVLEKLLFKKEAGYGDIKFFFTNTKYPCFEIEQRDDGKYYDATVKDIEYKYEGEILDQIVVIRSLQDGTHPALNGII